MKNKTTILATTYAVNPFKGSEDGMGWNFVCQIARFNKVIAITRENNKPNIDRFMEENPSDLYKNISFLYFDLPYWMRFWKKGGRGAMLYYWMWQRGIVGFIKKQKIDFDISHNLNFHNDWTPSYLWKLKKPFVWGPIGHHPIIPKQYLQPYKGSYLIKDRLTWLVKITFWNISTHLKRTARKADYVFCMNKSVPEVIELKNIKYAVMPSVATEDFGYNEPKQNKNFTLISAGRLVPLKGYDLSILAFADFLSKIDESNRTNCKLIIVGSGPETSFYKQMCKDNNIADNVEFIEWIERPKLMEIFKDSSAFLFPSHEGAGMVVAEALSFGKPVLCLDNAGPGEFITKECGFAVPIQDYENTYLGLSDGIYQLYTDPNKLMKMSKAARKRFETNFMWDRRGEQLKEVYKEVIRDYI